VMVGSALASYHLPMCTTHRQMIQATNSGKTLSNLLQAGAH